MEQSAEMFPSFSYRYWRTCLSVQDSRHLGCGGWPEFIFRPLRGLLSSRALLKPQWGGGSDQRMVAQPCQFYKTEMCRTRQCNVLKHTFDQKPDNIVEKWSLRSRYFAESDENSSFPTNSTKNSRGSVSAIWRLKLKTWATSFYIPLSIRNQPPVIMSYKNQIINFLL